MAVMTSRRILDRSCLHVLPGTVDVPAYARAQLRCGIVHIGLGNFVRAHQALYLDDLFRRRGPAPWAICGVGLLPQDRAMGEALLPQGGLYTLVERDQRTERVRVVGSVIDYVHAPAQPAGVLARLTAPATRIVSLTVTESGYYLDTARGELDARHPDLRRDLAHPESPPATLYGYLAEALARRRRNGLAPFTVQSCDNLQGNGDLTRRMLVAFARQRDPRLGDWIDANVTFPNSMVDRITPATTAALRNEVTERLGGIEDACPVLCETFRQWVIEDCFVAGRPPYDDVGVQVVSDVRPFEHMKIHLLNASHQALGHLGVLLGYETVEQAVRDPHIAALLDRYMDTVRPLLEAPPGVDLRDYQRSVIERFGNPAVKDQLARICFDASARIPKFVLPMARRQLEHGGSLDVFAFVIACWIRYLGGEDEAGRPIRVQDPMAAQLLQRVRLGMTDPAPFLGLSQVFGNDLPAARPFVSAVAKALRRLYDVGVRTALTEYAHG